MKRSDLPHVATAVCPDDGQECLMISGYGTNFFRRVDLPDGLPESMLASFEASGGKFHPHAPLVAFVTLPGLVKKVEWETLSEIGAAEQADMQRRR